MTTHHSLNDFPPSHMVFCIGGDKHPRRHTPVEYPERENAEGGQYSAHHCGITEKDSQSTVERDSVAAVTLPVVDSNSIYSDNAFLEPKQQRVQKRLVADPKRRYKRSLSKV